jgi:anaerobic magnesium-protoporphyrin IX monomethyl ester cyclase
MKIMLINPSLDRSTKIRIGPIVENLFYNSAPLGLCYLASVLEQAKHQVRIVDAPVEGLAIDGVMERVSGFSADMVGIATYTASAYSSYELAKKIRCRMPQVKIIIGGDHITSNPGDLLRHPEIDMAVIGEGEITLAELALAIQKGENASGIKGLAYRSGEEVKFSPPREYIANLDILPFPARHLVPIHYYKPQPNDYKRLPKLSIISSRGCPYACIFCDKNVFKDIYRSFSPGYIVAEMKHLVRDFRARDIAFVDSTFTPNKKRIQGVVEAIKKANLDVTWTCSARVDVLDKELLREMRNAGCWRIRLGIESGNDEVLKFIKKGASKYQVTQVAQWAYELGLAPKGFFMIGHLVDTKDTIEDSIRFACSLPLRDITVQMNTPLKNTPQYGLIEKFGRLTTQDASRYNFWEPIFLPHGLEERELSYYYVRFYLRFYLRPQIWRRYLKDASSVSDILEYVKGIRILFFFFISWLKKKS